MILKLKKVKLLKIGRKLKFSQGIPTTSGVEIQKRNIFLVRTTSQWLQKWWIRGTVSIFLDFMIIFRLYVVHSHRRCAAGSLPAGWAAGTARAERQGHSVGTGRRYPAADPGIRCCRTSQRSQRLCCPLVAGFQYCRSPSTSEDLKKMRFNFIW